jgi:hypothetical protein
VTVEQEGGWRRVPASRVAEIAEEIASTRSKEIEPAYKGQAVVYLGRGVTLRDARRTGIAEAIEEMHDAALRVTRLGPHAAFDVIAGFTPEEADALRDRIADVFTALSLLSNAVERHHGDRPAGQQRMPIAA